MTRKNVYGEREKALNKKWRGENKEHLRKYRIKWDIENKERLVEQRKKYREEHEEEEKKYDREYYWKNIKRKREYRKENRERDNERNREYYKKNKEKILEGIKRYLKTDAGKANNQRKSTKRRTKEKNMINTLTTQEWLDILEAYNYRCAYCGVEFNCELLPQKDHVIPISKGGNNTKENIVPACKSCNCKKGNKILTLKG